MPSLPPSPPVVQHHLDSVAVAVLAHPLRSRLVSTLRQRGPSTATDLARELDTNSGATSYHLRRLADAGVVVETDSGDRKRRVWAAAAEDIAIIPSDHDDDVDAASAVGWLERDWLRHFAEKFGRWLDVGSQWPTRWRDEAGMHDYLVVVTADQLAAMHTDVREVIERYRRAGQGNPEAKRVATYLAFYPVDMDQTPRR